MTTKTFRQVVDAVQADTKPDEPPLHQVADAVPADALPDGSIATTATDITAETPGKHGAPTETTASASLHDNVTTTDKTTTQGCCRSGTPSTSRTSEGRGQESKVIQPYKAAKLHSSQSKLAVMFLVLQAQQKRSFASRHSRMRKQRLCGSMTHMNTSLAEVAVGQANAVVCKA